MRQKNETESVEDKILNNRSKTCSIEMKFDIQSMPKVIPNVKTVTQQDALQTICENVVRTSFFFSSIISVMKQRTRNNAIISKL